MSSSVARTPRVAQIEGLFDMPATRASQVRIRANLPLEAHDWRIGLIVGPSGCGKSSLARELFGTACAQPLAWPDDRAIADAFPPAMSVKEVALLLSSVGFSSPPAWLRPYKVLSNGERFRADVARALAERPELAVVDEFTSVVDRTVARIGSCAVAKAVRRSGRRFVAVSCHYDIIDWLNPDWVYDPADEQFTWRFLQRGPDRPRIELFVTREGPAAWNRFRAHHYLSHALNPHARCFVARFEGRPAAFTAVLSHPSPHGGYWREHRTVCLPDFQGAGIGHALAELVAGMFRATGKRYLSITSHPAMIQHRLRSARWRLYRAPSLGSRNTGAHPKFNRTAALSRLTAGFEYIGPPLPNEAVRMGLKVAAAAGHAAAEG
jgi:GNAT superfamily N-acetyltransferase